jgi:hypothetical protein
MAGPIPPGSIRATGYAVATRPCSTGGGTVARRWRPFAVARLVVLICAALLVPASAAAAPAALRDLRPFGLRVHVAHVGAAGLRADHLVADASNQTVSIWDEYVVVAQRAGAVRIALDEDDARLLLWIAADDLAWTVARATRILGRGAAGVWVLPGAPLAISGDGRRVAATYDDDAGLTVNGTLARSALTRVFAATRERDFGDAGAAHFAREPGGDPLIAPTYELGVRVVDRGPEDWRLIEHRGRYVRIVGWARAADVQAGVIGLGTAGVGMGYGMSDTARVELPAGACLLDPDTGAIVGVQTRTSERYASELGAGRWSVTVGNAWGLRQVIAQDLAGGQGAARWRMCR